MVNSGIIEDVIIIGGLIGVQFVYAGNAMLMSYLMSLGLQSFTIVIFTAFATFILLLPFVLYFERSKWPKRISFKLFLKFLLLALGGVTLFQSLFLKGINLTSAAMGTAMPNLAPGFIFIIAWIFRLEKVDLNCTFSRVKIIGTLLCVLGAFTMSLMQSISTPIPMEKLKLQLTLPSPPIVMFDRDKIIGCLYLLVSILLLSSTVVLQAFTLGEFPAPMSLCAITSFLGGVITTAAQLIEYHEIKTGYPLVSVGDMIGYSVLSGAVTGICLSISAWALEKRGPVLVSMFSPVGTVCSVIFSIVTLGDSTVNIGSIAGMFLMFTGLYFVLWAKGKEDCIEIEFDAEKPLLS
ncbi:WAT1-related protein At5g47470-like [Vicia villosa]|uniref:WAT1-related protein At5g47470-like n=1 Tax=Vicia villosa TaxID=3911 RepID=UPI00273B42B5|nr:WAT1-related protein At5g47470-like [Vicia villosa]XP_058764993.1 WAT1-related protein At5g47470-like [Vicia villosa]